MLENIIVNIQIQNNDPAPPISMLDAVPIIDPTPIFVPNDIKSPSLSIFFDIFFIFKLLKCICLAIDKPKYDKNIIVIVHIKFNILQYMFLFDYYVLVVNNFLFTAYSEYFFTFNLYDIK